MPSPRTGANASIVYGWEPTTYGTSSDISKAFGAKTAITTLTLTNNRLDLGKLGQVETGTYAYGTQAGSVGVSFVLCDTMFSSSTSTVGTTESSGDIFRGIYGAHSAATSPATTVTYPDTHTIGSDSGQGKTPKVIESLTIDIGFDASDDGDALNVRTLKGCILNSLALSTSIGETINCTADFSYGFEDKPTKAYSSTAPTSTVGTPYTFAHAILQVYDYSASPAALATVQLVQDFDITFANNAELLYGLGSHQAVSQFRKALDITGKFKIPVSDYKMLHQVLAQIGKGGAAGASSNATLHATNQDSIVELTIIFETPITATKTRSIKIELQGVSITDLSWTGFEPVMPVYQDISFKAKSARIVVDTTTA